MHTRFGSAMPCLASPGDGVVKIVLHLRPHWPSPSFLALGAEAGRPAIIGLEHGIAAAPRANCTQPVPSLGIVARPRSAMRHQDQRQVLSPRDAAAWSGRSDRFRCRRARYSVIVLTGIEHRFLQRIVAIANTHRCRRPDDRDTYHASAWPAPGDMKQDQSRAQRRRLRQHDCGLAVGYRSSRSRPALPSIVGSNHMAQCDAVGGKATPSSALRSCGSAIGVVDVITRYAEHLLARASSSRDR